MSRISKNCFGRRSGQQSIKDKLGGALGNRGDAVKQYKKSEQKCRKELKGLKKQNKMLYRISKKSGSFCELKKTKNIKAKASKNHRDDISDSSSSVSDSDSSLSSDS